jgi:hypothetical protein
MLYLVVDVLLISDVFVGFAESLARVRGFSRCRLVMALVSDEQTALRNTFMEVFQLPQLGHCERAPAAVRLLSRTVRYFGSDVSTLNTRTRAVSRE